MTCEDNKKNMVLKRNIRMNRHIEKHTKEKEMAKAALKINIQRILIIKLVI